MSPTIVPSHDVEYAPPVIDTPSSTSVSAALVVLQVDLICLSGAWDDLNPSSSLVTSLILVGFMVSLP